MVTMPMQMLILALAGGLHEEQRVKIEFLGKRIRVLQELHGGRRPRLNDDQRRRLAANSKRLGR